jgi:hypothetical protein
MIGFFFITLLISPPLLFLILFVNIGEQADGRTKVEAQEECLKRLVVHPFFWLWGAYAFFACWYISNQCNFPGGY